MKALKKYMSIETDIEDLHALKLPVEDEISSRFYC